ncbi:hypothetical protein L226DRAFT_533220 [Lentinus tigrinus ALCF2SS1-7]|uniref:uncharacterized protein n=1 Tax=Lentinus tigrinus ALCF2SS1-7 TaxID=1328758 RepID=UPI001165EBAA|nr:hypothetical protein L226DRAFT_533220 [Lentinus tigrinus ALCF2SS1-7]
MAAVFLHNAIFTTEPPSPPSLAHPQPGGPHPHHRAPNRRGPHDRQLSSVSSVTLHTSTSEHSHPTEPLIHPGSSASSVYLDLLARQPTHPSSPPPARGSGLTLQGDPVTPRERRIQYEQMVRRRLKRLRWAQRALFTIIGGWAIYNTIRYYLSAWLHPYRERQVIALVLGSCTALCVACNAVSVIISATAPHLGWYYRPRSKHVLLQSFLHYSSSLCVLGPAIVNFIFVFLWRNAQDTVNSLRGRCLWDIDVVWSGLGSECDHSPAWGYWIAGSVVRLILTAAFLIAYHAVSYKYMVTRRPSRRRHASAIFRHSAASFPSPSTGTMASSRSFRPMATVSSSTLPVSSGADSLVSPRRERSGNVSDGETHTLRSARSRILAGDVSPSGSKVVRRAVSAQGLRSTASRQESTARSQSPSSSEEDTAESGEDRYGRPIHRSSAGYASVPLASPPPQDRDGRSPGSSWDPVPDSELNSFAAHFRALVEQVTRETDDAVAYAHTEQYDFPTSYAGANRDRDDAHVVVGRTIHRMPTIESLGSHEVMSLASMSGAGGFSRPSTRSNTLSNTDAPHSRSASRANSLDAAVSLSVSVDGLSAMGGEVAPGEMGQLTPSSATSLNGPFYFGSRSTGASYHTARSGQPEGSEEA